MATETAKGGGGLEAKMMKLAEWSGKLMEIKVLAACLALCSAPALPPLSISSSEALTKLKMNMGDGVPPMVSQTFSGLIPMMIVFTLFGYSIVFNLTLAVPFIVAPAVNLVLYYFVVSTGIIGPAVAMVPCSICPHG